MANAQKGVIDYRLAVLCRSRNAPAQICGGTEALAASLADRLAKSRRRGCKKRSTAVARTAEAGKA